MNDRRLKEAMRAADDDHAHPGAGPGRPYALHLFLCTTGTDCPLDGPVDAIRMRLKAEVKARGLQGRVRVNQSGCLNQCGHGPMLVVYPEGAWYAHLDAASALRVLDAHIKGDVDAVRDVRYRLGPGANKAPKDETGRRHCAGGCRFGDEREA
jgi:(2Fe-2S) ferredoxin